MYVQKKFLFTQLTVLWLLTPKKKTIFLKKKLIQKKNCLFGFLSLISYQVSVTTALFRQFRHAKTLRPGSPALLPTCADSMSVFFKSTFPTILLGGRRVNYQLFVYIVPITRLKVPHNLSLITVKKIFEAIAILKMTLFCHF